MQARPPAGGAPADWPARASMQLILEVHWIADSHLGLADGPMNFTSDYTVPQRDIPKSTWKWRCALTSLAEIGDAVVQVLFDATM
jgi:hypothetical protein